MKNNQEIENVITNDNASQLKMEYSGIMRFVPLIFVGGFFTATIFLFAFGPLKWDVSNPLKLYSFLTLCVIALVLGYVLSVYKGKVPTSKIQINTSRLIVFCSIIFFLIYFPTCYITTGKWYPDIITGITNTGKAYQISKYYNATSSPMILYIRMLLSPFIIMIMPITLFFMPKLSKLSKILGVSVIIATLCLSISQGVNKVVADFAGQLVLFLFMLLFSNTSNDKHERIKYRLKIILSIFLVCSLFFLYYTNSMKNRLSTDIVFGKTNINSSNLNPSKIPDMTDVEKEELENSIENASTFGGVSERKENYFLNKILPKKVESMITYLTSYLSHGYMGLSYAMDKDFTSTYGLGFSDFFRHNFLKVIGKTDIEKDIISRTYQNKTSEDGWHTGGVWSTFFVYSASDISFAGTVLLVFVIGYFLGLSWKDALKTENPFALVSFFCFCIMIIYFSANNQMLQGGENFIGFTSMLICWFLIRIKLFKKEKNDVQLIFFRN